MHRVEHSSQYLASAPHLAGGWLAAADSAPTDELAIDWRQVARWAMAGALFGLLFPVCAWLFGSGGLALSDVLHLHRHERTIWIVDLAPFVLGATGVFIGHVYARLDATRRTVEAAVQRRTADLEAALQELGSTQSMLVQAQKLEAIGQLAAGVAHEINTPIQYVGDNTRFLEEAFTDLVALCDPANALAAAAASCPSDADAAARYVDKAAEVDLEFLLEEVPASIAQTLDGVDRVAAIVRALKDFSHPGSEEMTPLDLNRVVETTLSVARNEWKYVADLITNLDPDLPLVPGLSGPLGQAFLIVIVNAAQAIADVVDANRGGKGTITIESRRSGDYVEVSIADDGPGIPEELRDRVFEHFFTTKDVGAGSGQGLAIARSVIVEQHGGELSFESELGHGTRFVFRLPLEDPGTP